MIGRLIDDKEIRISRTFDRKLVQVSVGYTIYAGRRTLRAALRAVTARAAKK